MTAPVPTDSDALPNDAPAPAVPALPDRADAPVSEVVERFLKQVIAEVPLDLIEELHLFSPLRQGTVETGIAVLAARVPETVPEDTVEAAGEPELFAEAERAGEAVMVDGETAEVEARGVDASEVDTTEVETTEVETTEVETTGEGSDDAVVIEHDVRVVAAEGDDDEDVSYADEADAEGDAVVSAEEGDEAEAMVSDETVAPAPKPVRHTVYTARYRYVIKGPERGKWESSVKAEADAPLVTVETVVRGVQRRAGEESEIVRYTGAQIARALRVPFPA